MVETFAPAAKDEVLSIQYLRGLAAFGVLIFHLAERAGGAFGAGAAGVDIFFVISGFIMWMVTQPRQTSAWTFLSRRVQRIAPLYWGVTLVVVGVATLAPGAFPAMAPNLEQVLKSLLFIPYRDPTGLIAPLVIPGWTLNYEIFFYLLFALTLLAPARFRPWLLSAALIILVALGPLGPTQNPVWATYTNPLLLEFGAGVWLGCAWTGGWSPSRMSCGLMIATGLAGLAASAYFGLEVDQARALLWGGPAVLIVAGAVGLERRCAMPRWSILHLLGDASYSLYLVHGLAISATVRILAAADLASPAMIVVCGMAAALAAGLITYHLAERPLSNLLRARSRRSRDRTLPQPD